MSDNTDFKDMFKALNSSRVRYLVVGAHAVMYYTEPRYTKDIDIWISPTPKNAARAWSALVEFGAPLENVTVEDLSNPQMVYQIGIAPNRIDIMMGLPGADFESAWKHRVKSSYGGIPIFVVGKADLIRAKKAASRPQDLLDIASLTAKWKKDK